MSADLHRHATALVAGLLAVALLGIGLAAMPAAAQSGPSLDCAGSGGGAAYVTDSGLTVYENDTNVTYGSFPDGETVSFQGGEIALSASGTAEARLESGTGDQVCLADVDATTTDIHVAPDAAADVTVSGSLAGIEFRDPVYDRNDGDTDLVYDAGSSVALQFENTGLSEGETVGAMDASGNELDSTTVDADGNVMLGELPSGTHEVDLSVRDPPSFQVSIDSTNAPVTEGDQVTVEATVSNTGGVGGTQTVVLRDADGTSLDSTEVTLSSGGSTDVQLAWSTASGDAGDHGLFVSSADDTASTSVTVESDGSDGDPEPDPASFEVSIDATNSPVIEGEDLVVTATVENVGGQAGDDTVTLSVDGQQRDTQDVNLDAGAQQTVELTLGTGPGDAGEYTATVATSNGSDAASVTVEADDSDGDPEPEPDGVSVELTPASADAGVGFVHTLDLVVYNATDGIGSYDVTVESTDPSVVAVENATLTREPGFPSVDVADDGSRASLSAGMGLDPHPAGDPVIATVTVRGVAAGNASLVISSTEVTDTDVRQYTVAGTQNATMNVTGDGGPPPVVGDSSPRDLDDDGLYRDVNGDGQFTIGDVQALFANRNDPVVRDNPSAFNFNGENGFSIGDVQALFVDHLERNTRVSSPDGGPVVNVGPFLVTATGSLGHPSPAGSLRGSVEFPG